MKGFSCPLCQQTISHRDPLQRICNGCRDEWNRIAARAQNHTKAAIVRGEIPSARTLACVDCGKPGFCYDHRDYGEPAKVEVTCRKCNYRRGPAKYTRAA